MEKVVNIINLKAPYNDYKYWQTKSPEERLAAIEFLRQQYIKFNFDVPPRFQRVYKVINRA